MRRLFTSLLGAIVALSGLLAIQVIEGPPAGADSAPPTVSTVLSGLSSPSAIAIDGRGHVFAVAAGNIYRANTDGSGQITIYAGGDATGLTVDQSTGTVYTMLGNGYLYSMTTSGTGLAAVKGGSDYIGKLGGLATDNNGHVVYSSLSVKMVCAIAGCMSGTYPGGSFTTLGSGPQSLAITPSGITLVVDTGARTVDGYGTSWANTYLGQVYGGGLPVGVVTDQAGNAYVFNALLSHLDIGLIPGLCNNQCGGFTYFPSITTYTRGMAADATGANLFFAQTANTDGSGAGSLIELSGRQAPASGSITWGGTITTLATGLSNPSQVLTDSFGHVFVDDAGNGRVVMVDLHTVAAPNAPTGVTASASDGQATVSWTASSGGATPWSYTVTASPGGNTCTYQVPSSGTPTNTCAVSGLTDGTAYTFAVTAQSGAGPSQTSQASPAVTPSGPPSGPVISSIVTGDRTLTVSWQPAAANGSPITVYRAYAASGFYAYVCQSIVSGSEVDSCSIRYPTNGTQYQVYVTATNALGTTTGPSQYATPATAPGAPTTVSVVPSSGQLAVSWLPPADNGGYAVTSYTATASPGGASCTSTVASPEVDGCTITGLSNGTGYTVTVTATSPKGSSPASAPSNLATPAAPPDAPSAPSAVGGDSQATVSWTAPSSNGSAVLSYTATASPGGATCTTPDGVTSSCTVTGLTNGTSYTFTVTATNGVGTGAASVPTSAVTPLRVAGAPGNVTATAANRSLSVSWNPPSSNGGSAITSYTATASPGGAWCSYTVTSPEVDGCTILNLTNGTSYTVTVRATNTLGLGPASAPSAPAIPKTNPGAPSNVVATPASSALSVTWSPPVSNGGSAISSYKVTAAPGGASCTYTVTSPEVDGCTISGLAPGTSYTVVATSTNSVGKSANSAKSAPAIPYTIPGAPSGVVASANGTGALSVTWLPPSASGFNAITSYTATASPGGQSCTYTVSSPEVDGCTINGLTSGSPYAVSVTATNAAGPGPASPASPPATPVGPPSAPAAPSVQAAPTSIIVSWLPANAHGQPITSYTATASPGGATCTYPVAVPEVDGCTINGLTNGASYTVSVAATNASGTGASSAPSATVIPNQAPGAPGSVSVTPAPSSLAVSWTAPTPNGGSPVSSYTATANPGAKTCTYSVPSIGSPVNSCTIGGLSAAQVYTVSVTATNVVGTGPSTTSPSASPTAIATAPLSVTASAGNASIVVSWSPPASTGNTPITSYTATAAPGGATCTYVVPNVGTPANSCTIGGLSVAQSYTATVTATNAVGVSPASSASNAALTFGIPSEPSSVSTQGQDGSSLLVSWSPPTFNGGSPLVSYTATVSPGGQTCSTGSQYTFCTITGLTPGTAYTATVVASNVGGSGPPSAPSPSVTVNVAPGSPANVQVTPGNGTLSVSWAAPTPNGGTPITGYTATAYGNQTLSCSTTGATSCVISNVSPTSPFNIWVTASNAAGTSAPSVVSGVSSLSIPAAPGGVSTTAGSSSLRVSWTPPAFTGNTPVTNYTATASPGGQTCTYLVPTSGPEADSCSITGLIPGTKYTVTMVSTNVIGTGPSTSATNPVTPFTVPGAPSGSSVSVTGAASSLIVTWAAPTSNGFSPITSYTATAQPGGKSCTTPDAITLSCSITGLSNGTSYVVTVQASNAAGRSQASNPGVTAAPRPTKPSAPTDVTAQAGSSQVQVTWTAGATGDSPITSATATASPGGAQCTSSKTGCTISGLTPGTSYTVSVKETNVLGTSPSSAASSPVTPFTVPGPVGSIVVTPGAQSIVVSWSPPISNGYSPITGYSVVASSGGGVRLGSCTTSGATSCTITGLSAGAPVNASVSAINAAGSTSATSTGFVTPYTTPSAPFGVTTAARFSSLVVSWTAPSSNGSTPITGYTATATPGGQHCDTTGATTCTITGLSNGTGYTVTVVAANIAGAGPSSTPSSPASPHTTAPDAPAAPLLTPSTGALSVGWSYPSSDGGQTITSYVATVSPGGATCRTTGALSCTVAGLTPGISYAARVTATNALGTSPSSPPSLAAVPYTTPGAPGAPTTSQTSLGLSVSWSAPASTGFSPLTGYTATATPGGAQCTSSTTQCTIGGLAAGTAYTVTVTAANAAGRSPASTPSSPTTLIAIPRTPSNVRASLIGPNGLSTDGSVSMSWTNGATTAQPVSSYVVTATASPGGGLSDTKTCTTSSTGCTLAGLHDTWTYSITVVASNPLGTSLPSPAVSVAPALPPSAPRSVTAATYGIHGGSAIVNWSPPANANKVVGGSFLYTATASPGGATCSIQAPNLVATQGCLITGLSNGTAYTFTVTLSVDTSWSTDPVQYLVVSPASGAASATPIGEPDAPATPSVTSSTGKLLVGWTAPASNGAPITSSTAIASDGQGRTIGSCTASGTGTSCTISGLTQLQAYNVTVSATNSVGTGLSSPAISSLVAPSGFGAYLTSNQIVAAGGTFGAVVAGAPANQLVTVTFTGGATGSCTTGAQGWCALTSSAATMSGTSSLIASYIKNKATTTFTGAPVAAPSASCTLQSLLNLASCTLSNLLPKGTASYELDDANGGVLSASNWLGGSTWSIDLSKLSGSPGGTLFIMDRPANAASGAASDITILTYTIHLTP